MPRNPQNDEERSDYISYCVKFLIDEGKGQKEALGQCYSRWKEHLKDKRKNSKADLLENALENYIIDKEEQNQIKNTP